MKKEYSKPGIIIEDFSIAQNIARNCIMQGGVRPEDNNHSDEDTCIWSVEGVFVFSTKNGSCYKKIAPGQKFGEICYNNPAGGKIIFGSY